MIKYMITLYYNRMNKPESGTVKASISLFHVIYLMERY